FLPERTFRGRQNDKLQYAVLAAAALHGGAEPDPLDETAWWQTGGFFPYALFATVAYIRAAAHRAGGPRPPGCPGPAPRPRAPARRAAEPRHMRQATATERPDLRRGPPTGETRSRRAQRRLGACYP